MNNFPPDALRYILWRYGQDHTGEDHQDRVRETTEWLARLADPPTIPLIAMTPERIVALEHVLWKAADYGDWGNEFEIVKEMIGAKLI